MVLKSLATFLQQAISATRDDSSNSSSSWYMASAFSSARAHRSFDILFEPSPVDGPSSVVWKQEAVPPEEHIIGTFPLANAGFGDGLSLDELSSFHSTKPGGSSSRLKHMSVCSFCPV